MKNHAKERTMTVTQQWFKRWSNEYDRTLGQISFHRGLLDLVVKCAAVAEGGRVLDIGCGTGLLSLKILQKYDCDITGIDCSEEMAAIFRDKLKKLRLENRVLVNLMDAGALGFKDEMFDAAVSTVTLHHLQDKLPALRKVCRMLKPGGVLVIGEVDMDTTGPHTDVRRLKRILRVLEQEWVPAMKDAGVEAFAKMFDNGKKHILNQGEYCLGLRQWASLCKKAGFAAVTIKRVPRHPCFGAVIARKAGAGGTRAARLRE